VKYLLVLVVVVGGLWLLLRKRDGGPPATPRPQPNKGLPAEMVACAHCDLRLPRAEAVFDGEGRPYCDVTHRFAGPR
jgi:hypothetical protein